MQEGGNTPIFRDKDIEEQRGRRRRQQAKDASKEADRRKARKLAREQQQNKAVVDNESESDPVGVFRDKDIAEATAVRVIEETSPSSPFAQVEREVERQLVERFNREAESLRKELEREESLNEDSVIFDSVSFDPSGMRVYDTDDDPLIVPTTGVDFTRKSPTNTYRPGLDVATPRKLTERELDNLKPPDSRLTIGVTDPVAQLERDRRNSFNDLGAVFRRTAEDILLAFGMKNDSAEKIVYQNVGELKVTDPAFFPSLVVQTADSVIRGLEGASNAVDTWFQSMQEVTEDVIKNKPINQWSTDEITRVARLVSVGMVVPAYKGLSLIGAAARKLAQVLLTLSPKALRNIVVGLTAGGAAAATIAKTVVTGKKDDPGRGADANDFNDNPLDRNSFEDRFGGYTPPGEDESPPTDTADTVFDDTDSSSGAREEDSSTSNGSGAGGITGAAKLDFERCRYLVESKIATKEQLDRCEELMKERLRAYNTRLGDDQELR
jgi:hypothetical protein